MNKSSALLCMVLLCTLLITSCDEPKAEETDNENKDGTSTTYTFKPTSKEELVAEIKKAIKAHGNEVNLNYIDTSLITDMSLLFSARYGYIHGYGLSRFNGDISKWDLSAVTYMRSMFDGARAFTQNLDAWKKTIKPELIINGGDPIGTMFRESGLKNNLPSWCQNSPVCRKDSLSFS